MDEVWYLDKLVKSFLLQINSNLYNIHCVIHIKSLLTLMITDLYFLGRLIKIISSRILYTVELWRERERETYVSRGYAVTINSSYKW